MAKNRAKPATLIIHSVDQANEVLAQIAARKRQIEGIYAETNARIDEIKQETANATTLLAEELALREAALASWAEHNRDAILPKGAKSLKLLHGVIGWRVSSKLATLKGYTWARVLGHLVGMKCRDAIRVKEEVDKEVLATWPEERLATVGVYTKKEDTFFYELDQAEPTERAEVANG
jgi:phage host-nuclease inhibitor protein Gam